MDRIFSWTIEEITFFNQLHVHRAVRRMPEHGVIERTDDRTVRVQRNAAIEPRGKCIDTSLTY